MEEGRGRESKEGERREEEGGRRQERGARREEPGGRRKEKSGGRRKEEEDEGGGREETFLLAMDQAAFGTTPHTTRPTRPLLSPTDMRHNRDPRHRTWASPEAAFSTENVLSTHPRSKPQ